MPSVDVMQSIATSVHQAKEAAQILFRLRVVVDHLIQRQRQNLQRVQMHHQRAQCGLQVRHHQRGRNALALHVCNYQQKRLRTEMQEIVIISATLKARFVCDCQLKARNDRRLVREEAPLDTSCQRQLLLHALLFERLAMQARVLECHSHVARELGEKVFVFFCKAVSGGFVEELDYSDNLARIMPDRHAEKRSRAVIKALVKAGFEKWMLVCVLNVHRLCSFGHLSRNSFSPRNTNLLMVETKSHNRPQLLLLGIDEKDAAAVGLHFLPSDLKNQLK